MQRGLGSWVDECLLLLIQRASLTEPELLQPQLETWGFSLRRNTTLCYHSLGLGLIVPYGPRYTHVFVIQEFEAFLDFFLPIFDIFRYLHYKLLDKRTWFLALKQMENLCPYMLGNGLI